MLLVPVDKLVQHTLVLSYIYTYNVLINLYTKIKTEDVAGSRGQTCTTHACIILHIYNDLVSQLIHKDQNV